MTAALACVIFHIYKDKYTSLTTGTKIVEILLFYILSTPDLGRHRKFERLLIVFGRNRDRWT